MTEREIAVAHVWAYWPGAIIIDMYPMVMKKKEIGWWAWLVEDGDPPRRALAGIVG